MKNLLETALMASVLSFAVLLPLAHAFTPEVAPPQPYTETTSEFWSAFGD